MTNRKSTNLSLSENARRKLDEIIAVTNDKTWSDLVERMIHRQHSIIKTLKDRTVPAAFGRLYFKSDPSVAVPAVCSLIDSGIPIKDIVEQFLPSITMEDVIAVRKLMELDGGACY